MTSKVREGSLPGTGRLGTTIRQVKHSKVTYRVDDPGVNRLRTTQRLFLRLYTYYATTCAGWSSACASGVIKRLERLRFKCLHIHRRRSSLCIRLGRPY